MTILAAAVSILTAVAAAGPTSTPDSITGPGEEVPYVGQDPLLCGGASLAMVLRFWGETGVYAEDFEPLVREEDGGIRTVDLAVAAEERGYATAVVSEVSSSRVFEALADGIPSILLLGREEPVLHYVVLVRADDTDVWVHDPAIGPMRRMSIEDLNEQWAASGKWALVSVPRDAQSAPRRSLGRAAVSDEDAPDSHASRGVSVRALAALKAGRLDEASRLGRRLLAVGDPDARIGRRVLATASYLSGDTEQALAEWNALGEPRVDLVTVHGSEASRHDVLARRAGIEPGEFLTPAGFRLARRRLSEEPALASSRVEYRPNPDGTVQVHAYVVDHGVLPTLPGLAVEGLRGIANEEVRLEAGPLIGSADRWALEGGWSPERSLVGGSVRTATGGLPGVVTVSLDWLRERYGERYGGVSSGVVSEARLRGAVAIHEWVSADTRLGASFGLERWDSGEHVGSASAAWLREGTNVRTSMRVEGWAGSRAPYGRATADVEVRVPTGSHQEWRWTLGGATTSHDAPRLVWPGAGTGRLRSALLRGYPLAEDGAISGPGFGPHLLHTSLEYRVSSLLGPVRVGAGLFSDAAYLRGGDSADPERTLGDAGLELFVDHGGTEAAASLARGDEGWVLSARVSETW